MKSILLIGLGRFGKHVAMHLHNLGHQVMAVDSTEERVNAVLPYVTEAQIGDSTNESFLSSLGIRNFDACIVAIGDNFQSSLETTSLLKELGAKLVVSRASSDVHQKFLLRNGADQVVYPEQQLAKWTAIRFSSNHILDFVNLEGDYDIYEVDLPERWVGMSVGEIDIRKNTASTSLPSGETALWISPSSRKPSLKTAIRSWFSDSIESCRNALRFNILFAPMRACETCRRQLLSYTWQHKKPFYGYLLNSRTFP